MDAPVTYAHWCSLLEQFEQGSNEVVSEMNGGSFEMDAGTAARFYTKTGAAYSKRKQVWLAQFQRAALLQPYQSVEAFGIALRNGRQALQPLQQFVAITAFPKNLQETLRKDLEDFVAEIKKSLKERIPKTDRNRESLLLIINAFGLAEPVAETPPLQAKTTASKTEAPPPTGRKIIF